MNISEIEKQINQRPFVPFQFCMSDGSVYPVRHPEMILVSQTIVVLAEYKPRAKRPEGFVFCDPRHIIRIEPTPNGRSKKSKSTKRKMG